MRVASGKSRAYLSICLYNVEEIRAADKRPFYVYLITSVV